MPDAPEEHPVTEEPLDELLAQYIQQLEAGHIPDAQALLAKHPALAAGLRQFLADSAWFDETAQSLHPLSAALPPDPGPTDARPDGSPRPFGNYDLLEQIGCGGMGVVYRARQRSLNRTVALKMILAGQFASPEEVRRLHREAESAANLRHPNIVRIHEVGEHEGVHFFTMDCIEGRSLVETLITPRSRDHVSAAMCCRATARMADLMMGSRSAQRASSSSNSGSVAAPFAAPFPESLDFSGKSAIVRCLSWA